MSQKILIIGQRHRRWGPSFGASFNPIWTKGADYARHITTGPPIFLDDAASLSLFQGMGAYVRHNWACDL